MTQQTFVAAAATTRNMFGTGLTPGRPENRCLVRVPRMMSVFDLLLELRETTGTAIVLITHDMGAIAELADRVAVMYAGRMIESGSVEQILDSPQHPYTSRLIACVPHLEENPAPERAILTEIPGVVPALTDLGTGCAFAPRCSERLPRCGDDKPNATAVAPGHQASCWLMAEGEAV